MEDGLSRFGVSMDSNLLEQFDQVIRSKGYCNRSEAIRDLVRDFLVNEELAKETEETESISMGTITLIYNHHTRELGERLTELQHNFHSSIISTLHVHLDAHHCLEVLVVRGKAAMIREIADRLISTRGVAHGKLVMSAIRPEW